MSSVHLVVGKDDLLVQRATERLLADLRDRDPDLEVEVQDATELDHLPELRTTSLFGGHVGIVVRRIDQGRADLRAEVEAYLAAPDDEAVLVLTVPNKGGKNQKVARLAKQAGEVHEVEVPPDWKPAAWQQIVRDEFARLGKSADADAVGAILDRAGFDPATIASQVAQACAAASGDGVTAADVERAVEAHGRRSGFELADAVADRDPAAAITLLRGLLEAGEAPLALLGALTYRFRQLQQVRSRASASELKMSSGQHRRLLPVANAFHTGELAWCIDRLAQMDVDLKGNSDLPPDLVLELGVIDLATAREVGAPWNPLSA